MEKLNLWVHILKSDLFFILFDSQLFVRMNCLTFSMTQQTYKCFDVLICLTREQNDKQNISGTDRNNHLHTQIKRQTFAAHLFELSK